MTMARLGESQRAQPQLVLNNFKHSKIDHTLASGGINW